MNKYEMGRVPAQIELTVLSTEMDKYFELAHQREEENFQRSGSPYDANDPFIGISAEQIWTIGQKLLQQRTLTEVYSCATLPSPIEGKSWYDILIGIQHESIAALTKKTLESEIHKPVSRSLDVATGTGLFIETLSTRSKHITVLDINNDMLHVSREKLERLYTNKQINGYEIQQGNAVTLEEYFPANTFSIITANGLQPYLTREQQAQHYESVYSVLNDGGIYCVSGMTFEKRIELIKEKYNYLSPRGRLAIEAGKAIVVYGRSAIDADILNVENIDDHGFIFFHTNLSQTGEFVTLWQKI